MILTQQVTCAEIVANSYRECFFDKNVRGLATARAGNVIGGGDFSTNRLIPDLIKAIINKRTLQQEIKCHKTLATCI